MKDTFKQAEILQAINNAIVPASRPGKIPKGITEKRAKNLKLVAEALINPLIKFIDESDPQTTLLLPEELVYVLLGAAAYVQVKHVMGRTQLPNTWTDEVESRVRDLYGS
jgi:hypothetical protein